MRPLLLKKPWRSRATLKLWIDFAFNWELAAIWQTSCVLDALVIGHWYDDPMRTIFSHDVVLKPVPVIVIDVPDGPWTGEIDVTLPIVQGVNRYCKTFDGVVWLHDDGLSNVLEPHDVVVGTVAKNNCLSIEEKKEKLLVGWFTCGCAIKTLSIVGWCWWTP